MCIVQVKKAVLSKSFSLMNKIKLLVVEDDPNLGLILKEYLEVKGYDVQLYEDGLSAHEAVHKHNFDLCLFDVMLPKMDGFTLAEKIRTEKNDTPIIFLTAKVMQSDVIKGLKIGADDYLTKPFSMEELLLRIQIILKRIDKSNLGSKEIEYNFSNFTLNTKEQTLYHKLKKTKKKLTNKESELLRLLCVNKGDVMERTKALKEIWHDDSYFSARSMDVYIAKLRKYLNVDANIKIITVHGRGFRLFEDNPK